jgi:hypothetical protein
VIPGAATNCFEKKNKKIAAVMSSITAAMQNLQEDKSIIRFPNKQPALIVLLVPTTIPEDTAARQCIINVQN